MSFTKYSILPVAFVFSRRLGHQGDVYDSRTKSFLYILELLPRFVLLVDLNENHIYKKPYANHLYVNHDCWANMFPSSFLPMCVQAVEATPLHPARECERL